MASAKHLLIPALAVLALISASTPESTLAAARSRTKAKVSTRPNPLRVQEAAILRAEAEKARIEFAAKPNPLRVQENNILRAEAAKAEEAAKAVIQGQIAKDRLLLRYEMLWNRYALRNDAIFTTADRDTIQAWKNEIRPPRLHSGMPIDIIMAVLRKNSEILRRELKSEFKANRNANAKLNLDYLDRRILNFDPKYFGKMSANQFAAEYRTMDLGLTEAELAEANEILRQRIEYSQESLRQLQAVETVQ